MKKLLFIFFTLISIQSFAQTNDSVYIRVKNGIPGVYNLSKNAGGDSIVFYVSGVRYALSVGTVVDLTPFVRKSDTTNMLFPYATKSKVQDDSLVLAATLAPAFVNQSFDTSTRALTLTRIDGTFQSVVIPRGSSSGTTGIAALSSSRTLDVVNINGDNGTTTSFSVNGSDSATRVHNGDNISVLTGTLPHAQLPALISTDIPSLDWSKITTGKPITLSGYGITDAYPLSGNPSGFLTAANITGKKDNTDSTNAITGYTTLYQNSLKVSTAVANATYATIANLNLKANDNQVYHLSGADTLTTSILSKAPTFFRSSYNGTSYTYEILSNAGGQFYIGQESSVAGSFYPGSSAYANVFYSSQPFQFLIGGKKFEVNSSGAALNTASNATGDFVTRNPLTGQLQIRTAAQTLTDIGAQPLENQRLSTTNDVGFHNVTGSNYIGIGNTGIGTYLYLNPNHTSAAGIMYLPRYSGADTLATKSELKGYRDTSYTDTVNLKAPLKFDSATKTQYISQGWIDSLSLSPYTVTSTSYTATATDKVIEVTATGTTQTLPTAVGIKGKPYTFKLTAAGTATIATTSSQTIDGSTTYSLSAQYKYVTVISNGANWIITENN
jgi:hypothetical protein